jgi:hypothetical protein
MAVKSFIIQAPRPMTRQNKLEHLFLSNLSSLIAAHLGLLDYARRACQCSSLFDLFVGDKEKRFRARTPYVNVIKLFSSRDMKGLNKLERLFLANQSSLV